MVAVVRSGSRISLFVVLIALTLGGCARPAPDLPLAYGSPGAPAMPELASFAAADVALTCEAIAKERSDIGIEMEAIENTIVASHGNNQGIGYVAAVIFPPLIVAADHHLKAKETLDLKQARLDRLTLLGRLKECPTER